MASNKVEEKQELPAVMDLPIKVDLETLSLILPVLFQALKKNIEAVRQLFKEKYADDIASGTYDQRDLDRFVADDNFAGCFLINHRSRGDVGKAAENADVVFKFRKEKAIWDWKDEDFPKEIWDKNGLFYHGRDRRGNPILQVRSKTMTAKTPEEIEMAKKFMVWHFEKHYRERAGVERVVVLFDMEGAGVANVNMDMSKYVTKLFDLFPSIGTLWKAVSLFLSEEQKSRVVICTKKDITKYIAEEYLLEHQKV